MRTTSDEGPAAQAVDQRLKRTWGAALNMLAAALTVAAEVVQMEEAADAYRLAILIAASVWFGVGTAQLPWVRAWLDRVW